MHVYGWHHEKSSNILITCLHGTCFMWHHEWTIMYGYYIRSYFMCGCFTRGYSTLAYLHAWLTDSH